MAKEGGRKGKFPTLLIRVGAFFFVSALCAANTIADEKRLGWEWASEWPHQRRSLFGIVCRGCPGWIERFCFLLFFGLVSRVFLLYSCFWKYPSHPRRPRHEWRRGDFSLRNRNKKGWDEKSILVTPVIGTGNRLQNSRSRIESCLDTIEMRHGKWLLDTG